MDQKQYEAMKIIAAKGRKFLDEIYQLMSDSGLLDEKYGASFSISNMECVDIDCSILSDIEVIQNYHFNKSMKRWTDRLSQWNKDGKGWVIYNDPCGESGTVPEYDDSKTGSDISGTKSGVHPEGKAEEPVATSDNGNMWFHDDDGDPPMVCRGDLNDSMAESGSSS